MILFPRRPLCNGDRPESEIQFDAINLPRIRRLTKKALSAARKKGISAAAAVTYLFVLLKAGGLRRIVQVSENEIAVALADWERTFGALTWENLTRWERELSHTDPK